MARAQGRNGKGQRSLPRKREMTPVPKASREVWSQDKKPVIAVPSGYRKRWSDSDTEAVIRATPEEYSSYEELAQALAVPRTSGAVRMRKAIAIALLDEKDYAFESALSGNHKHHDWAQVHRVLQQLGFMDWPISQKMHYARHLRTPSPSWRGDGTQTVLRERKLSKLDTRTAVKELIQRRLDEVSTE